MSTKKLQQSHLQQSVKNFPITLQKENQIQKKLKHLFYIKSKHIKKYFNNHPYFGASTQMNESNRSFQKHNEEEKGQQRIPIINEKRLKTQQIMEPSKKVSKRHHTQFVSLPTQYGLENTYNYIKQRSFLGGKNVLQSRHKLKSDRYRNSLERSQKMSRKYSNNNNNLERDENTKEKRYMRPTQSYESRVVNSIEGWRRKGLSLGIDENNNRCTNYLQNSSHFNISIRKNSLSLTNQPQLHQSTLTLDHKSLFHSNSNYKTSMSRYPSINLNNFPAKHQVKFLYGKRLGSVHQIPHRFITFDLFQHIIATFLKCKIHYKDMNQTQYNFISAQIKRVLKENKKPEKYDIKDIVNISTIKQLIKFLQQFSEEDYEMTEIIRYFFLFNEEKALKYHLQKVKDEVANFIAIKFDAQFGKKDLYVFDLQTKKEINHFYDLLQGERFIIGDDSNVMMDYVTLNNKRAENQQMEQKIKKWKSIADCETLSFVKNSTSKLLKLSKNSSENKIDPSIKKLKLTDEKFNLIFDQFKIRQQKRMSKHINLADSKTFIHNTKDTFVQRSRLKKEQDFFQ